MPSCHHNRKCAWRNTSENDHPQGDTDPYMHALWLSLIDLPAEGQVSDIRAVLIRSRVNTQRAPDTASWYSRLRGETPPRSTAWKKHSCLGGSAATRVCDVSSPGRSMSDTGLQEDMLAVHHSSQDAAGVVVSAGATSTVFDRIRIVWYAIM